VFTRILAVNPAPAALLTMVALLLSAATPGAGAQGTFPAPVAQALAAARIPAASVSAFVQEVGAGRSELSVNAGAAMNPASVMKLVTTYAALDLLGPAYRWKTEAYTSAPVREGVLEGDLVLKGYGDPKLDLEAFWVLLRALRGKGLREIRGDLVLDRSHFAPAAGDAGRFDGDTYRPYNVLPDALLVNFKSLRFTFLPEPAQGSVRLYVEPRPPALEVVNVLRLVEGACPQGQAFRDMLGATFEPARQRALFSGRYPASCGEKDLNVALLEPNDQIAGMMRQFWAEMGGTWTGAAREGPVPPGALLLHAMDSAPLAEIVRDTNKFSNNIMARHIYLTLGAESAGPPADAAKAASAVKAWIARKKISAPEIVLENGSGLSRIERISAANLAALLQAAWRGPVMSEFIASLPVAAVDGTMRRRLKGEGIAGQAHIKTGLLADVRAMAGYVLDRTGRRHVVVMIVNHPAAPESQAAFDALLRWVY